MADREELALHEDKRYVRRDGASLSADARQKAMAVANPGQGDRGDRRAT